MTVGLTGGIGSGKSTVARLLEIMGCEIFNSDEAAKDIYKNPAVKEKVIALLGKESYDGQGGIDKLFISSKIFNDTLLLHQLNNIIHPAVKKKMEDFVNQHPGKFIIKETALLFETGLERDVDKIIVVSANEELRIKRVMLRDGLTHAEVMLRIKKQLPEKDKIAKADFVIYNNDEELVIPQVLRVFESIKKMQ